ncbi:hypothetical protein QJQ45_021620, partial [Haematococcus lacustris]
MGRKKSIAHEARRGRDASDSDSLADSAFVVEKLDVGDAYETAVTELGEKRASTREGALRALISLLKSSVMTEQCAASSTTIVAACIHGVRRGGEAEAALAAQLLGLHSLTLADSCSSILDEVWYDLQRAAGPDSSASVGVCGVIGSPSLAAAMQACCSAQPDDHTIWRVMTKCQAHWETGEEGVRTAALVCWAFLTSLLTGPPPPPLPDPHPVLQLGRLLHDPEVKVRTAAGEALSLLAVTHPAAFPAHGPAHGGASCHGPHAPALAAWGCPWEGQESGSDSEGWAGSEWEGEEEGEEEEEEGGWDGRAACRGDGEGVGAAGGCPKVHGCGKRGEEQTRWGEGERGGGQGRGQAADTILQRMRHLARSAGPQEQGLRKSRRERSSLKASFRAILKAVETGKPPVTKVNLAWLPLVDPGQDCLCLALPPVLQGMVGLQAGDVLVVDSLAGHTQLAFFRRVLAGGFQAHLQHNPVLHTLFGFTPATSQPARLSALEKRLLNLHASSFVTRRNFQLSIMDADLEPPAPAPDPSPAQPHEQEEIVEEPLPADPDLEQVPGGSEMDVVATERKSLGMLMHHQMLDRARLAKLMTDLQTKQVAHHASNAHTTAMLELLAPTSTVPNIPASASAMRTAMEELGQPQEEYLVYDMC